MTEQLPLPETLIVVRYPCHHPPHARCGEDTHVDVHIDGYCRLSAPLPDGWTVRRGDWTEATCTECHIRWRVVNRGETVRPVHEPGRTT